MIAALGLVNSRLTLIGNDSHQFAESSKVDLESKLLTPGQVADLTTDINPAASIGAQFAVLDLNRHLNNSAEGGLGVNMGGMLTFIDVVGTVVVPGGPAAQVTSLTPATNDGTLTVSVDYTITGTASSASWFLDNLGGTCTGTVPFAAGAHTVAFTPATLSSGACGPLWLTGNHVLWIQPFSGAAPGSASGDSFTLALQGPSVFGAQRRPAVHQPDDCLQQGGRQPTRRSQRDPCRIGAAIAPRLHPRSGRGLPLRACPQLSGT